MYQKNKVRHWQMVYIYIYIQKTKPWQPLVVGIYLHIYILYIIYVIRTVENNI